MRNTFAFHLSPFTLKSAFCILLGALCLIACRFNPNVQTPGESYLQGEWQQDSVTMQKQLVSYSLYNLKFNCDSFFVSIKTISKVNPGADSCTRGGKWTEYAKGVYEQRNDTLHVRGLFCNSNYSYKEPTGCFRSGVYEEIFKVTRKTDSVIQFSPTSSVISFNTRLIKRNTCNPKSL
jgi:hypothetical protein